MGNARPMTVGARLYRVEQHMSTLDKKLDQIMNAIHTMSNQQQRMAAVQANAVINGATGPSPMASASMQPLLLPAAPSLAPSPIPMRCLEDDV